MRLGQAQGVDEQRPQGVELVSDRTGAAAHLGGEVREQQLERPVDEVLREHAKPRRQGVVLALAGELLEEGGGAVALGGEGHALTVAPPPPPQGS